MVNILIALRRLWSSLSEASLIKRERELGSPVEFDNVAKRTAMAVNLSESTVKRITREFYSRARLKVQRNMDAGQAVEQRKNGQLYGRSLLLSGEEFIGFTWRNNTPL